MFDFLKSLFMGDTLDKTGDALAESRAWGNHIGGQQGDGSLADVMRNLVFGQRMGATKVPEPLQEAAGWLYEGRDIASRPSRWFDPAQWADSARDLNNYRVGRAVDRANLGLSKDEMDAYLLEKARAATPATNPLQALFLGKAAGGARR